MKRNHFLTIAAATAMPLFGAAAPRGRMVTTRDIGCGCCASWVSLARAAGYTVELHDLDRPARLRGASHFGTRLV